MSGTVEDLALAGQIGLLEDQARVLLHEGNKADAIRLCRQILKTAPKNAYALQTLSTHAMRTGDLRAAKGLLEQAIRAYPERGDLHQHLSVVLRSARRYEDALAANSAALRLSGDVPMLWVQRARILVGMGRSVPAASACARAERLLGGFARYARDHGERNRQALQEVESFLVALRFSHLEQALALQPDLHDIYTENRPLQTFAERLARVPVDWVTREPQEPALDLEFSGSLGQAEHGRTKAEAFIRETFLKSVSELERIAEEESGKSPADTVLRRDLFAPRRGFRNDALPEWRGLRQVVPTLVGLESNPYLICLAVAGKSESPPLRVNWLVNGVWGLRTRRGAVLHHGDFVHPIERDRLLMWPSAEGARYSNRSGEPVWFVALRFWHPLLDAGTRRVLALIWDSIMRTNRSLVLPSGGQGQT